MTRFFVKNGIKANLHKIEKTDSKTINLNNTIGVGFPVAQQGTYPFVWNFIQSLPDTKNTDIFIVDTLFAYSGGVIGPIKRILKRKGYNTIGAKEILMSNNMLPKKIDTDKNKVKIKKGKKGSH